MDEMMNKVLADIVTIMSNKSSLSESFYEAVLKRLISFGYTLKDGDAWQVCFAIQKIENHINNYCNTSTIPDGLKIAAVDMVCGEFLFSKKQTGQLDISGLDFDGGFTSIKEGDVSVSFGGSSDEDKFNKMVDYLRTNGESEFICYRKIRW